MPRRHRSQPARSGPGNPERSAEPDRTCTGQQSPADRHTPVEPMPAPAMVAPQLVDSIARTAVQTRRRRAHLSHRSSSNRRTRNRSDPNHDNLQARVGCITRRFHRLVGLGRSRFGCPDARRRGSRSSTASASSPEAARRRCSHASERSAQAETAQPKDRPATPELSIPDDLPPVVINVEPKVGATDVDPEEVKEIRVTFSKKMTDKSWSWPTGNKYAAPKLEEGKIHFERDGRTCVMPVKLEPGKTYVMGVNSERFHGFQDSQRHPALPYLLVFSTKPATGR